MSSKPSPFQLLKTYPGLIHRQPIFVSDNLQVDSYHLTFLGKEGEKLDDDSHAPAFLEHLADILSAISARQKALLSVPESWQEALIKHHPPSLQLTLDVEDMQVPETDVHTAFSFARHAIPDKITAPSQTLLINLKEFRPDLLSHYLTDWRQNHQYLCATHVNQHDEFMLCRQYQLDLLQGQFFTRPSGEQKKMSPSTQILMELLVKLQDPDVDAESLAYIIQHDVTLSYKLLRLINSAFFALPKQIENIKQGIVMLGHNTIKTWASLLALSQLDDKPVELRAVAMTRAKMCELLAKYYKGQAETFFTAGLFSTLDAMLDQPLPDLLGKLPLARELEQGLLHFHGHIGRALNDVLNYEKGDWAALQASPLPVEILGRAYLDAIHWSKELGSQLTD